MSKLNIGVYPESVPLSTHGRCELEWRSGRDAGTDGLRHFDGRGTAAQVTGVQCRVGGHLFNDAHQLLRCSLLTQMVQQHTQLQNVPTGFASPLPMMSKAKPGIGSNMLG